MNIRQNLVDILNERADAVGKLVAKRDELERDIKSGRFSAAAVAEMRDKLLDVRASISQAKDETRQAVARLVSSHVAELNRLDSLNPHELDDGDLRLLNSGLPLTKRDLTTMLERHQATGNTTMQQVVSRWAREHDVNLGVFVGHEEEIAAAKQIPGVVGRYVDHWIDQPNAKDMVQRMFVDTAGA